MGGLVILCNEQGNHPFPTRIEQSGVGEPTKITTEGGVSRAKFDIKGQVHSLVPLAEIVRSGNCWMLSWLDGGERCLKYDTDAETWRIPTSTFNTIAAQFRGSLSKQACNYSSIASNYLKYINEDPEWRLQAAVRLVEYFGGTIYGPSISYFSAKVILGGVDLDNTKGNDYATQICPAVTHTPAPLPAINDSNDVAAIVKRIYDVTPVLNDVEIDITLMTRCAKEFAKEMVSRLGTGVEPISQDEVILRQKTKATRDKNFGASLNLPAFDDKAKVKAFLKKESYPKVNDPRNISDINAEHNLMGFRFLLPVKERLKTLDWYMPGKHPRVVGQRVVEYVSAVRGTNKYHVLEGDYSRFDGSQCKELRHQAFTIIGELIDAKNRADWMKLAASQLEPIAHTSNEHRLYETCGSMVSGSFFTTDGNTIANALVAFTALFHFGGLSASNAFDLIGLIFGDDSLSGGLGEWHESAAKAYGLSLKMVVTIDHVTFLSRYYPRPTISPVSCPAVRRALDKIHIIPRKLNDKEKRPILHSKLSAYLIMGPNAPLLSNVCRAILRLNGLKPLSSKEIEFEQYWLTQIDMDETPFQKLDRQDWEIMSYLTSEELGIHPALISKLCNAIDNASTLSALENIIPSTPQVVKENYSILASCIEPQPLLVTSLTPLKDAKRAKQSAKSNKVRQTPVSNPGINLKAVPTRVDKGDNPCQSSCPPTTAVTVVPK